MEGKHYEKSFQVFGLQKSLILALQACTCLFVLSLLLLDILMSFLNISISSVQFDNKEICVLYSLQLAS